MSYTHGGPYICPCFSCFDRRSVPITTTTSAWIADFAPLSNPPTPRSNQAQNSHHWKVLVTLVVVIGVGVLASSASPAFPKLCCSPTSPTPTPAPDLVQEPLQRTPAKAESTPTFAFEVKPYGVLGTGQSSVGSHPPGMGTAILDPAGLQFIRGGSTNGAGGASGAIYKALDIQEFPQKVQESITAETQATRAQYQTCDVIHVAAPDLTDVPNQADALNKLTLAYWHVFQVFAVSPDSELRLLPISGGIFSGRYASDMPSLTRQAMKSGYSRLSVEEKHELASRRIELCIWGTEEFQSYVHSMV
mmetsp:Transcript_144810/g.464137  ORF Transcript_144810/g.464137 Transcript_144810/m.464137 type:complete len:304 (+) Transcript_144810:68-979(+)